MNSIIAQSKSGKVFLGEKQNGFYVFGQDAEYLTYNLAQNESNGKTIFSGGKGFKQENKIYLTMYGMEAIFKDYSLAD